MSSRPLVSISYRTKSSPRFRWVACQIDHLCELPNDKARSKALDKLPRGLPETYERILSRILDSHEEIQDLVSRTFQWLAGANYPYLSGAALLEALALKPGDTHLDTDAMTSEEEILRWCSSLIRKRATGDGIEFAHFTVKEYLLSIDPTKSPKFAAFKICSEESNLYIGKICLTYLNLDKFGSSPPPNWRSDTEPIVSTGSSQTSDNDEDTDSSKSASEDEVEKHVTDVSTTAVDVFEEWFERHPLLNYAAPNWHVHLKSHFRDSMVVELAHKLLHPLKSNWFLCWVYSYLWVEVWEGLSSREFSADDMSRLMFPDATTLHWAASLSLDEVCSWLIRQGSDVNFVSSLGSPLDCALLGSETMWRDETFDYDRGDRPCKEIDYPKAKIVLDLITAGARVDKRTDPDLPGSPLKIALVMEPNNSIIMSHILDYGAPIDVEALKCLEEYLERLEAAGNMDLPMLSDFPETFQVFFSRASCHTFWGETKDLFLALSNRIHPTALRPVGQQKQTLAPQFTEDIDILEERFLTASEHGIFSDVSMLMSTLRRTESLEVERVLTRGLSFAASNNHERVMQMLLDNKVNPNHLDHAGNTALHTVLDTTVTNIDIRLRSIRSILEHGADVSKRNKKGELPLHLAAKSKDKRLLQEVYEMVNLEGAETSLAASKPSLLQYAVAYGCDENVSFLMELCPNLKWDDRGTSHGSSLMSLAAVRETSFAVRLFLERGMPSDLLDMNGSSVLYYATDFSGQNLEPLKTLLDSGVRDNSARPDGRRAIHAAASSSSRRAI